MYQTHGSQHNLRFVLTCVAVLAIGCILRLQPWRAASPPEAAAAVAPTPTAEATVPLPEGLPTLILGFYDKVDRGQYGEAYEVSFEPKWTGQPGGSYQPAGLIAKQEFVEALTAEFGANGAFVRLDSIQVLGGAPLSLPAGPGTDPPEYAVLAHLPAGLELKDLYEVQMHGALGDSCTPKAWWKRLLVARFADGQFRVLLPGGPRPGGTHKTELFTDYDPFAANQAADLEEVP